MALYDYECPKCGEVSDVWAKMEDTTLKHSCGHFMRRLISRFNINPDYEPWRDDNLCGQDGVPVWVKSRRHHKQLLRERGLEVK